MRTTYLSIDLATVLLPLIFSFHPRIGFFRLWRTLFPAVTITAALFLFWDSCFTRLGVWGFNPNYLLAISLGDLPLEEWLFFYCIPFACIFTLYCLERWPLRTPGPRTETCLTWFLAGALLATGLWKRECRYTTSAFLSLGCILPLCLYILKPGSLGRFYTGWSILLFPLLLVDGLLTGTGLRKPIVWYNPADIIGIRVGTIPIEDFAYGMELILLNLVLFEWFTRLRFRTG